ncbi:MAG TPA: carbon monoxide dehydrogenase subunit G [Alphaproteobacteria bacterium]|nr:carbon monoxide dehydrogenase subunit G [Alphaproteobacteria bacterium]
MELTGEYRIPATRQAVWDALNDPDTLKACIPGCEELEKRSPTEFLARVTTRIGPVSARFSGKVTLSELDPPNGYRIGGEGQGGAAGFAKGGAHVRLVEDGAGGSILTYNAEAQVGGKLAQIGSRLIAGTAQKLADQFFACLAARVVAAMEAPPAAAEAVRPSEPQPAPVTRRLSPLVWIPALILLVLLLLWLFGGAG